MIRYASVLAGLCWLFSGGLCCSSQPGANEIGEMVIRVAEIEVASEYLAEYKAILQDEAAASVSKEQGVIAIFPMYERQSPQMIHIVEVYASRAAYDNHLTTPHFQNYKKRTRHMIKSLRLIDMNALDTAAMKQMFIKL